MKHKRFFLFLAVLVIATLACGLFSGGGNSGVGDSGSADVEDSSSAPESAEESSTGGSQSSPEEFDTEFPLPEDVQNFMQMGEDAINYQTSLSLTEVIDFYRESFESAGYQERDILTTVEDTTFSIVWDGHESGKALVVQGVDLGNGTTNVNVRLEDV